jgi:hypothetical protein
MRKKERAKQNRLKAARIKCARELSFPVSRFIVNQPLIEWISQEYENYGRRNASELKQQ